MYIRIYYNIILIHQSMQINSVGTADEIFEQVRPVFDAYEVCFRVIVSFGNVLLV